MLYDRLKFNHFKTDSFMLFWQLTTEIFIFTFPSVTILGWKFPKFLLHLSTLALMKNWAQLRKSDISLRMMKLNTFELEKLPDTIEAEFRPEKDMHHMKITNCLFVEWNDFSGIYFSWISLKLMPVDFLQIRPNMIIQCQPFPDLE